MNYTEKQLEENYQSFLNFIEETFEGERQKKLLHMYGTDDGCLGLKALVAPASGKVQYHNAFTGGYIDHVLNVTRTAKGMCLLFKKLGGEVDFEEEELMFAALNHDLGKLGDLTGDYYLPEESDWHRKNQGSMFKINPDIQSMTVPDRAFFLLNHFGITMTQKEFLGIKLADGMYDESNEFYLKSFRLGGELKTLLPKILHWADHMATTLEYTEFLKSKELL
tara:strand:+ start:20848 stop:21513 length:666 start_codon:yes stop_codon:yes gene_type:complete